MATWYYGYVIMLLAEYQMATGDDSFMPGMKRIALKAANGQSDGGSWGHKFAALDGRLFGYGRPPMALSGKRQQNPSIQDQRRWHRFANHGICTRDLYKHHQE